MSTSPLIADHDGLTRQRASAAGTAAVSLTFDWTPVGISSLNKEGGLVFPRVPSAPGLYLLVMVNDDGKIFYIGQSDNLARRFQHYRTPGPSQPTNIRLNCVMKEMLSAGGRIEISIIADGAMITVVGDTRPVDLDSKVERVLLEHAAIAVMSETGVASLNK